jgi:hypothetical protein
MAKKQWSEQDKAEWMNDRLNAENARGEHSKGINALPKVSDFKKALAAGLNKKGPNRQPIVQTRKVKEIRKAKTLSANIDSECFSSLDWADDICTCVFKRDGYVLDIPMSRAEFLQFVAADSGEGVGEYYNSQLRD